MEEIKDKNNTTVNSVEDMGGGPSSIGLGEGQSLIPSPVLKKKKEADEAYYNEGSLLTTGGQKLNEIAVINVFYIGVIAFHANLDPLGGPDTHTLWFQFGQLDAAKAEAEIV